MGNMKHFSKLDTKISSHYAIETNSNCAIFHNSDSEIGLSPANFSRQSGNPGGRPKDEHRVEELARSYTARQ